MVRDSLQGIRHQSEVLFEPMPTSREVRTAEGGEELGNTMKSLFLIALVCAAPGWGQTMYKCPDPSGVTKYQQMPCSPTGGGDAITVKPIAGSGGGLRPSEAAALKNLSEGNAAIAQARAEKQARIIAEDRRQEALNVEREKAEAMREQAAAIRALGYRY